MAKQMTLEWLKNLADQSIDDADANGSCHTPLIVRASARAAVSRIAELEARATKLEKFIQHWTVSVEDQERKSDFRAAFKAGWAASEALYDVAADDGTRCAEAFGAWYREQT